MKRKTTAELLTEVMLRLGYVDVPVGDAAPPRRRKPTARRRKTGSNGKAR